MSSWSIEFIAEAEDDLQKFDATTQDRIIEKLEWLGEYFDGASQQPLSNVLKGYCKLRIGSTRVIYTVDIRKRVLMIRAIGPRDKIYKRFGTRV